MRHLDTSLVSATINSWQKSDLRGRQAALVDVLEEMKRGRMAEKVCSNCKYWERTSELDSGDCHRYAPPQSEGGAFYDHPCTHEDDWCGEWAQKG